MPPGQTRGFRKVKVLFCKKRQRKKKIGLQQYTREGREQTGRGEIRWSHAPSTSYGAWSQLLAAASWRRTCEEFAFFGGDAAAERGIRCTGWQNTHQNFLYWATTRPTASCFLFYCLLPLLLWPFGLTGPKVASTCEVVRNMPIVFFLFYFMSACNIKKGEYIAKLGPRNSTWNNVLMNLIFILQLEIQPTTIDSEMINSIFVMQQCFPYLNSLKASQIRQFLQLPFILWQSWHAAACNLISYSKKRMYVMWGSNPWLWVWEAKSFTTVPPRSVWWTRHRCRSLILSQKLHLKVSSLLKLLLLASCTAQGDGLLWNNTIQ